MIFIANNTKESIIIHLNITFIANNRIKSIKNHILIDNKTNQMN